MTRLQALTLCRDAVERTKGITAGLWYRGPNMHCTIGAMTQVAIDIGFPEQQARQMMDDLKTQMGTTTVTEIVDLTDRKLPQTPAERRLRVLKYLNDEIAKESERAPSIPTAAEIMNHAETQAEIPVAV